MNDQNTQSEPTATDSKAKWAAVVNDKLAPMPRRHVLAKDILYQAGEKSGLTLIRDFDSPNDIGFDPEALVDLAEGNVFLTASDCERRHEIKPDAPAKLAFVADDRWAVTIQPKQTGDTLRALLSVPDSVELFRDLASPIDQRIGRDENANFADGPVFISKKRPSNVVEIFVEGTPHEWDKPKITYAEVVTLFDPAYPQHPEITYSVAYEKGPNTQPDGVLVVGASVKVKNGMEFNVSATNES